MVNKSVKKAEKHEGRVILVHFLTFGSDVVLESAFGWQSKLFLPVKTKDRIKSLSQKSKMFNIIRVLIRHNKAYSAEKSENSYYFTELALLMRCSLKQDI